MNYYVFCLLFAVLIVNLFLSISIYFLYRSTYTILLEFQEKLFTHTLSENYFHVPVLMNYQYDFYNCDTANKAYMFQIILSHSLIGSNNKR